MFKILVVEDDIRLNQLIRTTLSKNGFNVTSAYNGVDALEEVAARVYDLIISDIMMPKMDGYEFAKKVRESNSTMPILFVTAKDKFEDKAKGFDIGIDDYMVKPIDIKEMVLRVNALLRRSKIAQNHKISVGDTILDYDDLSVRRDGEELVLPKKEFNVLFKLLSYPNKIFTRSQLMDEFWGSSDSLERTVDVHITRIREKFKDNPDFEIITARGLGYKAVVRKKNDEQ